MTRVLIADTPEGAVALERILMGHECTVVDTMSVAGAKLNAEAFALIVVTLQFDSYKMFELIRSVRKSTANAEKPVICFCSRQTPVSTIIHESLESATRVLGAWMYLDEHSYNGYRNPDAELRRVMERCLTHESRQELQHQRYDIQKQREELLKLQLLLQTQEWSPEMKRYLGGLKYGLKNDLELLLNEATRLHSAADAQRAKVAVSRDLKD